MIEYRSKDASNCLPAGEYTAEVYAVTEGVSKKGQPMYTVVFKVPKPDGTSGQVRAYFVVPSQLYQLKKLAAALGEEAAFEAERFDPGQHHGKILTLVVEVENDPKYGDRNNITAYKAGGDYDALAAVSGDGGGPGGPVSDSAEIPF